MATRLSRVLFGAFPQLRYEPTAKRIRARAAGHTVVDTLNAYLVWEPRRITPVFAVPETELSAELAPPSLPAPAVGGTRREHPPGRSAGIRPEDQFPQAHRAR